MDTKGTSPQDHIQDMIGIIVKQFDPDRIILFGSYARETAGRDSDVDLLIVMPVNGSTREMATEIDRALSNRVLPVDLLVVTPDQFNRYKDQIGSVIRPAVREGKVVYERAA